MAWFYATSVSVTNGATVVSVNAGDDIALAQGAGGLVIGTQPPVEIKRSYLDGSSNKKIELLKPWPYGSQTNQAAVAFPTDGDLAAATAVLKQLIDGFTLATQADAEGGTENSRPMTAARVKQAMDKQLGTASKLTATTSTTDSAQGRALRVGDFGIGAAGNTSVYSGDIALISATGVYSGGPAATGGPAGVSLDGAKILHLKWADPNSATQIIYTYAGSSYSRNITGGVALAWRQEYSTANALGAVAFSSGVNTGALFEFGTNSNGSYLKMADGSAVAWGRVIQTGLSISPTKSGNTNTAFSCTPTLPMTFQPGVAISIGQRAFYDSANDAIYSVSGSGFNGDTLMYNLGTKPSVFWPALDTFGTAVAVKVDYYWTAIGRWR